MKLEKHNPNCKLVGCKYDDGSKLIHLVYAVSNEGENEGLEAYYFKGEMHEGHYRSYRWEAEDIPEKYKDFFFSLKENVSNVPDGYKLELN